MVCYPLPSPFHHFHRFSHHMHHFHTDKKVKFLKRLPAAAGHCFGPPILASKSTFPLTFSINLTYFHSSFQWPLQRVGLRTAASDRHLHRFIGAGAIPKNSTPLRREAVFQDTHFVVNQHFTALFLPLHIALVHSCRCVSSQSTRILTPMNSIFGTLFSPPGGVQNSSPPQRGAVLGFFENWCIKVSFWRNSFPLQWQAVFPQSSRPLHRSVTPFHRLGASKCVNFHRIFHYFWKLSDFRSTRAKKLWNIT